MPFSVLVVSGLAFSRDGFLCSRYEGIGIFLRVSACYVHFKRQLRHLPVLRTLFFFRGCRRSLLWSFTF